MKPENLTLRFLQELRQDMSELRAEQRKLRKELTPRINGLAVLLTSVAGITRDHEERIEALVSR